MSFEDVTLEQLGAQAYAHYKAGEKANRKANDHATSSGLYLAEAKRRIDAEVPYGQRTQVWVKFLKDHCPLKRTRAEQLIAVATGKTTEVEVQEKDRNAKRETRARAKASLSGRPDKVQQERDPSDTELSEVMARIMAKLARLSVDQLHAVERLIPNARED